MKNIHTKPELIAAMRQLFADMFYVGFELERMLSERDHAQELISASIMVREWADAIEKTS